MNNAHVDKIAMKISEILFKEKDKLTIVFSDDKRKWEDLAYYKNEPGGIKIYLLLDKSVISSFTLQQLPGCCGVCVSHDNRISLKYRGKGLNNILNQFRIDIARDLGYTILMCTDVHDNIAQKKTLVKNGWQDIFRFRNKRTNNLVDISIVQL